MNRSEGFTAELTALLRLAGPIVLSGVGAVGMNTADTIMVGPLGAESLAAAGVGAALHILGVVVCSGILTGMSPLVSQAFGADRREECRRVLVNGLWLALAVSVPVVAASVMGRPLATALGQQPAVARLAGAYLRALAPGVPPIFLFYAFRQYLEGMGVTRPTMLITLLGLGINILFNRLLIYGVPGWIPALGVAGSGWATTVVRWSMLAAMLLYLLGRADLHPSRVRRRWPDRERTRSVLAIGLPIGAQMGLEVGLFSFAAVMMGWLGPVALAAHQVTINIASTTFMVALGASIAGSVRVGQHIGAGRVAQLRRATGATYLVAVGCMAAFAILFLTTRQGLIGLYSHDRAIVATGSRLLLVAALFQVFDGAQVAGMSVLRGAADTRVPMLIAALGYWGLGVPTGYVLAFTAGLGPTGVWIGLCVGLGAVAVLLALRVRHRLRALRA